MSTDAATQSIRRKSTCCWRNRRMPWPRKYLCVISAFLALIVAARAQDNQFEGKRINAIEYTPSQTLDPGDLTRVQPLHVGGLLHASDVADAIDRFFATGRYEDIRVEARADGAGVI